MIRLFDILLSGFGLICLSPVFIVLASLIKLDSKGPVFFKQMRVGKWNRDFYLLKFRTMRPNSEQKGQLTVGGRDPRITSIGYFLRKYKLDELPQLINVFMGQMSLVGPRPEVRKYVNLYSPEQRQVLNQKPGITDYASIEYSDENEKLAQSENPEKEYIEVIMPEKLLLNQRYIQNYGIASYLEVIVLTIKKIFSSR